MEGRKEARNAEYYVSPLFFEKAGDNKSRFNSILRHFRNALVLLWVFGVRVSVTFHLTCVHIMFSSVLGC